MPLILAIDTTGEFGSIALHGEPGLVEEVSLYSPDGFGHILFQHIGTLLSRHNLNPAAIDCFAAASGPGSFTGVRVGLAAAKGMGEACGKPVIAVSNLRALAWHGTAALRAPFLDARRGEIFGGVFTADLQPVREERVARFQSWRDSLGFDEVEFITPDPSLFPAVIATPAPRALGGAVAAIAWRELLAGRSSDPAAIDANYVRRSDAELLWKDR